MSWEIVEIKSGKTALEGHLRGLELQFPNQIKEANTLIVNGSSRSVESWAQDDRDDIVHVMLAGAGGKEKSDDEPDEGPDSD